jgi:hypothetical protein
LQVASTCYSVTNCIYASISRILPSLSHQNWQASNYRKCQYHSGRGVLPRNKRRVRIWKLLNSRRLCAHVHARRISCDMYKAKVLDIPHMDITECIASASNAQTTNIQLLLLMEDCTVLYTHICTCWHHHAARGICNVARSFYILVRNWSTGNAGDVAERRLQTIHIAHSNGCSAVTVSCCCNMASHQAK